MRTTSKEVTNQLREHILDSFEEWESYDNCDSALDALTSQLEYMRYDNQNTYQTAVRLVEGGQFLIYFEDVKDFLNELGINPDNKDYGNAESWRLYIHLMAREITKMVEV